MIIRNQNDLDKAVASLASLNVEKMPGAMEVVLTRYKKTRSTKQNSLYWGEWIQMIGNHNGDFPDAIHEILKQKFCPAKDVEYQGEAFSIQSTKLLDTKEFSQYLETIYYWAEIELGVKLRWPDEWGILEQRNY